MPWPIASDYNDAIQSPTSCFADPDLKRGTVQLDRLGLPQASSGMFASVYDVSTPTGRWAVKCFLTSIDDQPFRYDAISKHLASAQLPFMVHFRYLPNGILVRGQWYPILKMEWVKGESLSAYITRHVNRPDLLLKLAREWCEVVSKLKSAGIAHGDLQHGNVLVTGLGIRLIDYDGMFIPAFAGRKSYETGHRNYQHPDRDGNTFDGSLDTFSAWVIFVSILATHLDPTLWMRANAGDECLLFRSDDFRNPNHARIFELMERSRPEVRALATQFRLLLDCSLQNLPTLDGRTAGHAVDAQFEPVRSTSMGLPSWIVDETAPSVQPVTGARMEPSANAVAAAGADWILDHVSTTEMQRREFGPQFIVERFVSCLAVAALACVPWAISSQLAGPVPAICFGIGILMIVLALHVFSYQRLSVVREKTSVLSELSAARTRLFQSKRQVTGHAEREQPFERELAELRLRVSDLDSQFDKEQRRVQGRQSKEAEKIDDRSKKLDSLENDALTEAERAVDKKRGQLSEELWSLDAHFQAELRRERERLLDSKLSEVKIRDAAIPGFGPKLLSRLQSYSIVTAKDASDSRVRSVQGIGETRARAVSAWRKRLMDDFSQSVTLSSEATQRARKGFDQRKQELEGRLNAVDELRKLERTRVMDEFRERRAALVAEQAALGRTHRQELYNLRSSYQCERDKLVTRLNSIQTDVQKRRGETHQRAAADRRRLLEHQLQVCRLERRLEEFKRINAVGYVKRLIGGD